MKKLLLSALAVCAFTFGNAQEEKTESNGVEVSFGAKGGSNLANINGDIEDNSMKVSYHVGGVAEISLNDKFALQPELVFSAQGTSIDVGADEDVKMNLTYLNMPVMAKYFVTEGLSLEAGPQLGVLVNAKAKFDGDSEDIEDLNTIDFGMNMGAGYKLDNGLNFTARYNLGLSNINDVEGDDSEISNGVFQLSVGFLF